MNWKPVAAGVVRAPELFTFFFLVVVFVVSAQSSEYFLSLPYLLDRSTLYMEMGILALAMTFVIAAGHIDLSIASILALSACVTGYLYGVAGAPFWLAAAAAPLVGVGLGAVNGALTAYLGLPSLAVTLGSMALYRGMAQGILGDGSASMPGGFIGIDFATFLGLPVPLVIFIVLAVFAALALHQTTFGRQVLAIGVNAEAARLGGSPTRPITMSLFMLSGLAAGCASLMMNSRLGAARYDHALGMELDVITIVVLGGASIFGGRATIAGTVLALLLLSVLKTGMGIALVQEPKQLPVIGGLLVGAVLTSNGARWLSARLGAREQTPSLPAAEAGTQEPPGGSHDA